MLNREYFLIQEDQQRGPYTFDQLIDFVSTASDLGWGEEARKTLVWHQGLSDWVPLGTIVPPPMPTKGKGSVAPPPLPRRTGGWLLFLCMLIGIGGPVSIVLGLYYVWDQIGLMNQLRESVNSPQIDGPYIYTIFQLGVAAYSAKVGYDLAERRVAAVRMTKNFLILTVIYPFVTIFVISIDPGFPTDEVEKWLSSNLQNALSASVAPQLGCAIIWYQYLRKSIRVKETFLPDEGNIPR